MLPEWSWPIRNYFWWWRYCRVWQVERREHWEAVIAAEKKRLRAAGVDRKGLRLLCRNLADPFDSLKEAQWEDWWRKNRR